VDATWRAPPPAISSSSRRGSASAAAVAIPLATVTATTTASLHNANSRISSHNNNNNAPTIDVWAGDTAMTEKPLFFDPDARANTSSAIGMPLNANHHQQQSRHNDNSNNDKTTASRFEFPRSNMTTDSPGRSSDESVTKSNNEGGDQTMFATSAAISDYSLTLMDGNRSFAPMATNPMLDGRRSSKTSINNNNNNNNNHNNSSSPHQLNTFAVAPATTYNAAFDIDDDLL
jgi:hypothetical protein